MSKSKNQIILSEDGSHTVMSGDFGVTYHSKYGAIGESQVVFIDAGLEYILQSSKNEIRIFEMGFGTGLNALMSLQYGHRHNCHIEYKTIEAYPVLPEVSDGLNYLDQLGANELATSFQSMHGSASGQRLELSDTFFFTKYIQRIEEFVFDKESIDCFYFDAFAPTSQEELWTLEIMTSIYKALAPKGVLVSYCAKGVFKRTLRAAGFEVESIPGPLGKREMTRAHKK